MAGDVSSTQPTMQHAAHDSALSLDSTGISEAGASKVRELEEEVRYLADKANSASQKFADYENEIRVLQARLRQHERRVPSNDSPASTPSPAAVEASPTTQLSRLGISRFPSFMRKPVPSAQNTTNGSLAPSPSLTGETTYPSPREKQLEANLAKEHALRTAAENKVVQVNSEIEELSASLFQQANEMVAHERRESARLKERIKNLEQTSLAATPDATQKENLRLRDKIRTLEMRDAERKKRLERLEAANRRIERVRAMLVP